jgi:hypothetical protein
MRIALAVLMLLHGIAHLPGFMASWRLAELKEMPYHTTVLAGRVEVGDTGIRFIGVLWLAAALAFVLIATSALMQRTGWAPAATAVAISSLLLSVLGLPDSRIGIAVNLAILTALLLGFRLGWL